jgi:flavin reductase (DIM6/NTAB) family NADH-FMN oxidoreductase RutF
MAKVVWKPGTMIYPVPVVMVSCGNIQDDCNIITVAWTGTICTDPAMCYISVRPERYSYDIIKRSREFVINLTTAELAYATDWCGVKSGRDFDKFREMRLTPVKAQKVKTPLIKESPLNIECKVKEIKSLGSHDMFIAEVVGINAEEQHMNMKTGAFKLSKANPICYLHGNYFMLGKMIGRFGFSVQKRKK